MNKRFPYLPGKEACVNVCNTIRGKLSTYESERSLSLALERTLDSFVTLDLLSPKCIDQYDELGEQWMRLTWNL